MNNDLTGNPIIDVAVAAGAALALWGGAKVALKRFRQYRAETKRTKEIMGRIANNGREADAALRRFQEIINPPHP